MKKIKYLTVFFLLAITYSCNKRLYVESEIEKNQAIQHYENIKSVNVSQKILLIEQYQRIKFLSDSINILNKRIAEKEDLIKKL